MDQQNQSNTPDGSGDVPLKRKRGRPRKYPRPDVEESSHIQHSQNKKQNPVVGEQAPLTPGSEGVNGNQHLQRSQDFFSNDAMVGQAVSGVIEAVFDAGYLLSVRVGDSDTTLRGLVFKPGRYVPISHENDVAPGVPMIQRNEIPFPSGTTQVQTPFPKERNQQHVNVHRHEIHAMNGSPSVPQVLRGAVSSGNLPASLGTNVLSVAGQTTPQLARANLATALFQPNNFSNGMPVSNQPSQVMTQVSLSSGASVAKEIPVHGNQGLPSHNQTSQNMSSSSMQGEGVPHYQPSASVLNEDDAKSIRMPGMPFEQLVTEVVKRIQAPSDTMEIETDNSMSGDKIQLKDPSSRQEDNANVMDQPILIKPLQAVQSHPQEDSAVQFHPQEDSAVQFHPQEDSAVQSHPQEDSASAPKHSCYTKTGKMTELLQDNKMDNQASKVAELGSELKLDDVRNLGTELEDGGTVQSTKPF